MNGSGWHRLVCGVAVFIDEEDQPTHVCDLGTATLDIDDGVFVGDAAFSDVLEDELRESGWEVVLGSWEPTSEQQRWALSLELDDDRLAERASCMVEVLRAEPVGSEMPPLRSVPGMDGIEVDQCGAFVARRSSDESLEELLLQESGGVLEVEIDGTVWCVDELVRRAWEGEDLGWEEEVWS